VKRQVDLSLYVVLDAGTTPLEHIPDLAEAVGHGGATVLQLRDKTSSARRLIELARTVKTRVRALGIPVIVNDRVDVAAAAGVDGAHIGQDDLPAEAARSILGQDAIIGLSVTCMDEVEPVDPAVVDHVGLGPIFTTSTKPDAAPPLGVDGFRSVRKRLDLPVVAIGGIGMGNAGDAIAAGADGIAVVTAVAHAADPQAAARQLLAIIRLARRRTAR
jgi:thiamine-phosphate pyrophosphorylase